MSEHNVMINPDRPLVIYESMSFELDRLNIDEIDLALTSKKMRVEGKRGYLTLEYELLNSAQTIGRGCKRMVLSGLRPYDEILMNGVIDFYNQKKEEGMAVAQ